jgi:hypothetical protein
MIKYIFTTTTGFGLLAPGHHQVSLTGLDQSEVRGGRGGRVKTLAESNKLKA